MTRKRRLERRRKRTENDIRWTGESALYATITVFAAASVIVSFAKVPFKVSVDAFVPSLDLFLLATGLVFYGVLNLWSLIPDQKATLLGVAALVLMCVPIGWFAWKYIDISNLVRVHLARVNTNPLDSSLPRVGRAHLGIDHLVYRNGGFPIIDAPPVLALTDARAFFGQVGGFETDGLASTFLNPIEIREPGEIRDVFERFWQPFQHVEKKSVLISADRCVASQRVFDHANAFGRDTRVYAAVVNPSAMQAISIRRATAYEASSLVVYELSNLGIQMTLAGRRILGQSECDQNGTTICSTDSSRGCDPTWRRDLLATLFKKQNEAFPEQSSVLLLVEPDVPFQHVVTFIDEAIVYGVDPAVALSDPARTAR